MNMALSEANFQLFRGTQMALQDLLGKVLGVLPQSAGYKEYLALSTKQKIELSKALLRTSGLYEAFALDHDIPQEHLDTAREMQNGFRSEFILIKCLESFGVFLCHKTEKIYHVVPLYEPFRKLVPRFPTKVETTLYPFKGQIVYDGYLVNHESHTSPELVKKLDELHAEAFRINKIVTYFDKPPLRETMLYNLNIEAMRDDSKRQLKKRKK
jgi:hypothetical protein